MIKNGEGGGRCGNEKAGFLLEIRTGDDGVEMEKIESVGELWKRKKLTNK